jgi:hypothetical protein
MRLKTRTFYVTAKSGQEDFEKKIEEVNRMNKGKAFKAWCSALVPRPHGVLMCDLSGVSKTVKRPHLGMCQANKKRGCSVCFAPGNLMVEQSTQESWHVCKSTQNFPLASNYSQDPLASISLSRCLCAA